ncbi:MAG: hypothetical protein PVI15_07615, partial [Chromatiales bacterium]
AALAGLLIAAPISLQAQEEIELDGMAVIGNRELPKALYIVPWKQPELGDIVGRPVQSLLDAELEPVDRDVLRRELEYFGAVHRER